MSNISPAQRKAIEALATGHTVDDSALLSGVTPQTVYRWRRQAEFRAALNEMSDQLLQEASTQLVASVSGAISTLRRIAADEEAPASTQVAAARAILDAVLKLREQLELLERIEALEAQVRS